VVIRDWLRRLFGQRRGDGDPLAGLEPQATWVIVGLGNPGPEYADTRHNIGFRVVEEIARGHQATWHDCREALQSLIAAARTQEQTLVLAKPQTFMNRSGTAVAALLQRLAIAPDRCLVVYDDMDLPFGTLRLRERGSGGTHNGMRSVGRELHTEQVARLRVGIGQSRPGEATDHVLGEFAPDAQDDVQALVERAAEAATAWAIDGPSVAMNRYNKA